MRGSCLCGAVAWQAEGPLDLMSHCHCSRCRKVHGSAFGTYLTAAAERFAFERGHDGIVRFASSPGFARPFCARCGSVVPDGVVTQGRVVMPAGPLDGAPGVRLLAHIFVASKAPWYEIADALPRFATYPEGFESPMLADRAPTDPPGAVRGSCLCDAVGFVLTEPAQLARYCHCSRCRKARSAAFASTRQARPSASGAAACGERWTMPRTPSVWRYRPAFFRRREWEV